MQGTPLGVPRSFPAAEVQEFSSLQVPPIPRGRRHALDEGILAGECIASGPVSDFSRWKADLEHSRVTDQLITNCYLSSELFSSHRIQGVKEPSIQSKNAGFITLHQLDQA